MRMLLLLGWFLVVARARGDEPSTPLTLQFIREQVLASHPRITVAELRALASREELTAARSAYYPAVGANVTAVGSGDSLPVIAAGSLNSSSAYSRVGIGANFLQLITDFGRTINLVDAARLRAQASASNVVAARAQILLEVDSDYFNALAAQSVRRVARQTLQSRELLLGQIQTLASNQLKSQLDVSMAQVNVDGARLLTNKVERDWLTSLAVLASLMGRTNLDGVELAAVPLGTPLPDDPGLLVAQALEQRPELSARRLERDAAGAFARAERDRFFPTISAFGAAGLVPVHDEHFDNTYAAAGLNLSLPLFSGGLLEARRKEASALARAAEAAVRDAEYSLIREVRVSWLEARSSRERVDLTTSLVQSTGAARSLTQARFDQGLASIVDLSLAELNQTSAEIDHAAAEYEYQIRRELVDYQTGSLR